MTARHGNRTIYPKQCRTDDEIWHIEKHKGLFDRTYDGVRITWQHAVNLKVRKNADPLITLYSQVKQFQFWRDISCEDFSRGLELIALVTRDAVFAEAATRMKKHGLVAGGIKTNSNRIARECLGRLDAITMPCVHMWLESLKRNGRQASVTRAAMLAAIDLKIPGSNFDAVVQSLRKRYVSWVKSGGELTRELVKP